MMQKLLGMLSPEGAEPEAAASSDEQKIEARELFFSLRRLGFTNLNRIMDLDELKLKELLLLLIEEGRWHLREIEAMVVDPSMVGLKPNSNGCLGR